ncbi:TraB/GumN family protein [Novosphingobium sp. PC22D]|nr:TraB/GumN family protein [Novosphingobium sp. PC22D]
MRAALLAFALFACAPEPLDADPAIWRVEGPDGQKAWLFGTIHAADRPLNWRSPPVDAALVAADEIIVEVADMDQANLARRFAALSRTSGLPPLIDRVPSPERAALAARLEDLDIERGAFAGVETWAAALTLARAAADHADPDHGVDRAVIAAAAGKPVRELEGADAQLRIFDALPEREQFDLLGAVLDGAENSEDASLVRSWARGDMTAITRETRRGLLADPELRAALYTGRNRRWTATIERRIREGHHPFVAVGAAHLAGPDGLPAMLEARGFKVTRIG